MPTEVRPQARSALAALCPRRHSGSRSRSGLPGRIAGWVVGPALFCLLGGWCVAAQVADQFLVDRAPPPLSDDDSAKGRAAGACLKAVAAAERGVSFVHRSGALGAEKRFMIECVGAGLGLVDVDADGDLDLYLVQGGGVDRGGQVSTGDAARDALYFNDGSGHFVDGGPGAGELGDGFGFGVTAGDVDGDGDEDLLITQLGSNQLLLNDGAGHFSQAPQAHGLAGSADDWSMAAVFGDADVDGDLDVYVSNYLAHDLQHPMLSGTPCRWLGCEVPCGPSGLRPQADRFHLNDGAGNFVDVTDECGLGDVAPGYAFQVVFADLDGDRDLDLFVANDSVPNTFFVNQGTDGSGRPRFEEQGMRAGVALSAMGKEQAGMGVALGDVDGDLLPDMVMTNFSRERNALFLNASMPGMGALFFDESGSGGIGRPSYFDLGWGATLFDVELDGDLDLFVTNGHIYPQVDGCEISEVSFGQHDRLSLQVERGRFAPGPEVLSGERLPSRGLAAGDLDGDGDIDLVSSTLDGAPVFVINESVRVGHWLLVELLPALDAVGAVVTVEQGTSEDGEGRVLCRAVLRGSSFLSTEDRRLHFGLPGAGPVTVSVTWPDGVVETHAEISLDRQLTVTRAQPRRR